MADVASESLRLARQIASSLQAYRQRWNETSKAISDFELLHEELKTETAEWEQRLNTYGLMNDQGLRTRFDTASRHLDEERRRFSDLQKNGWLLFWTKAKASPKRLTRSIDRLNNDFLKISKFLIAQEDMKPMLASRADDTPDSLGFGFDPQIVKFGKMEAEVLKELYDFTPEASNKVVNLYGEPGSGKTCLAKSIAYQIHDAANNMRRSSSSSTHTSITENNTMFKDGAVFLTCDPQAEDCGKLCGEILAKISAPGQDTCVDKELSEKLRAMRKRLETKHVLIVFDNVMNLKQIEDLLVSAAKGVKYLVTCRFKEVWPGAKCVHMDKPTIKEAFKILATRAKMPKDEIPRNLLYYADEIICKVGRNVLGLAIILTTMKDPLQQKYWEMALKDLTSIDASLIRKRRVEAFGQPYPYTLSVLALEALHDEALDRKALDLLYLVAVFGGDGVPEPLLELAFRASHPKLIPDDFVRAWDELEEHDLIQVECCIDPLHHFTRRTCVLNPTRRLLIRKKKQKEVNAKLIALLNSSAFKKANKDMDALVAILCLSDILYFSATSADEYEFLTEEASKEIEKARKRLKLKPVTEESETLYSDLIRVIGPLIHLLNFSNKREGWELQCRELARKAIMNYIQKGHLDDEIVPQLLQIHQTFFVTCDFLWTAFFFDFSSTMTHRTIIMGLDLQSRLMNNTRILLGNKIKDKVNDKNMVLEQTLMVLIGKYLDLLHLDDSNLNEHLGKINTIISNIVNTRNCDYVLEHSPLLEKLDNMMFPKVHHNLKQGLALLKLFQSSTARKTIANHPRLLESIINEVYNSTSYDIGEHDIDIVCLLCGLASERMVAVNMVTSPSDFIPKLLELISARSFTYVDIYESHDFNNEIHFRELLNLMAILARTVYQIDDHMTRSAFASTPGILERLLLDPQFSWTTKEQKSMIKALTIIGHANGNAVTINLKSPDFFEAIGEANLILGLHKEALANFEAALEYCQDYKRKQKIYMLRCMFCKVKLEDYKGALHDGDNVVKKFGKSLDTLQERGVVKEMMGDYKGAIKDLTEALKKCKGGLDYECLKHRAFAHFKLGSETKARQDAKMANQLGVPDNVQKCMVRGEMCLGILPVPEFLGYKLT